ncbi:arsenate reductase (glutaredoxin) [Piscirickettsia litoralis]|uniref:Arsenate reductase n=2 Tax=Piscirickettsia litoralis TaxID=1891921 RepID=A0ABX3A519_9GAMM|nr:arsenate reductase (glutaredoxin) [Piscirickettsia litoralis]
MSTVTIYHNPRCSKSRKALEILEEKGHTPVIIDYLEQSLTKQEIQSLLSQLSLAITEIIRQSEDYYKAERLNTASAEELITHLIKEPKLLQRPIVISNHKAVIARPPERVLEIL